MRNFGEFFRENFREFKNFRKSSFLEKWWPVEYNISCVMQVQSNGFILLVSWPNASQRNKYHAAYPHAAYPHAAYPHAASTPYLLDGAAGNAIRVMLVRKNLNLYSNQRA